MQSQRGAFTGAHTAAITGQDREPVIPPVQRMRRSQWYTKVKCYYDSPGASWSPDTLS